ncbi:MAG TPA: metallophosphoesterase [Acidobacteriaceae bacterium]|nr:metallophosphoesterase [Acidobacteriaceae bacterium]
MTTATTTDPARTLSRRQFLGFSVLAAGGGLVAYSGLWDRHHLEVVQQTIRLRRLPEAFHGLRIAQVSDIHYDEYTEPYFVREVVRRINALNPDIVVLTGDFVTDGPLTRPIAGRLSYPCAEILSGIQCPHRFASLGNHDMLVGWPVVVDALKVHGIPTLFDSHLPFERNGSRLWFAGVRSSLEDVPNLNDAVPRKVAPNEPVILLAHEPDYANHVVAHGGVDLMLSGHTHGGQVRLPFLGTPRHMLPLGGRRFVEGHFNVGPLQLYVNRGIGTVKLPVRFLCPPELTVFTLQPAAS